MSCHVKSVRPTRQLLKKSEIACVCIWMPARFWARLRSYHNKTNMPSVRTVVEVKNERNRHQTDDIWFDDLTCSLSEMNDWRHFL